MKDLFKECDGFDIINQKKYPKISVIPKDYNTFFTANVLQHNTDETCEEILQLAKNCKYVLLYEATSDKRINVKHCASRTKSEYIEMVCGVADKKHVTWASHIIHNSEHTVFLFQ